MELVNNTMEETKMGRDEGLAFITDEQLIQDYKDMGCLFGGGIGEVIKTEMIARGIWKDEYQPGLTKEARDTASMLMRAEMLA